MTFLRYFNILLIDLFLIALPIGAQTMSPAETDSLTIVSDTLVADSTSLYPEWYVKPEIPKALRAPKHTAAAKCVMDSMLSFNEDSVLIEASHYEYDNAGRVIREIVWTYNADGSKIGKSKLEYSFDAYDNQVMTAVYAWDNATQTWKGTEKYEFVYDSEQRMISSIDYVWVTNEWKADDKKTWLYDAEGRVAEYFEYKRNTANNELQYSKGFTKQWDAEGKQTLDIQYTAAVNNVWTAGTKREYGYDENGNLTLSTLSTISNGAWIGSSKETWYYGGPSGEMTLYETYGWANNDWSKTLRAEKEFDTAGRLIRIENYTYPNGVKTGTKKEVYTFTSAGKPASTITYAWVGGTWVGATNETWLYDGPAGQLTLHEKFEWSNDDWSKTLKEETEYSGANIVRIENYTYANGVPTGTKKELTTYSDGKKTQILTFAWENGDWVNSNKETWEFNGPSGKQTKHEKGEWNGSDWTVVLQENTIYDGNTTTTENYERLAGVWTGTKKEANTVVGGKPTETIIYSWENGAWVNASKETWGYTSGKKTSYEKYLWENGAYIKSAKEVWAYDGNTQTLYEKYTGQNDTWVGIEKEVWAFSGTYQTLHETYEWYNNDWSMTLRNISAFDESGNQTLVENYTGTNGTVKGVKKEEYTFKNTSAGIKQTSKKTYTWNATKQAFIGKQWNVSDVDAVGNIIESCTYTYNTTKDAWVGTSTGRTLKTYNSDKNVIDEIVQKWNTTITPNGWLNNKRTTTDYYDKKNPLLTLIYKWSKDINDWVGVTREERHYTDAGLNDSIRNFRFDGTVWNPTSRTVKKYDENENNILTHNANWNGEKWVMSSMTRMDISDKTIDGIRQILQASWKCNADSIWFGDQKDTASYLTDEKLLFRARYSSWSNGDWVPAFKLEYEYDAAQRNTIEQRLEWTSGAWVGKYRYEKLYDNAGRELLNASYDGWDASRNDWIGDSKTTTTYNAAGKRETQTIYRWRATQWEPLFINQYGYDTNGREVEVIVQMYLFENWINTNRTLKEYDGSTLIKDNEYTWKNEQWVCTSRNEIYYDNDAQHKLRREIKGIWGENTVVSFSHYYYLYSCDPCIIRFVNYDGTELESKTMDKGQMPAYSGATPVREGDAEYSYTFLDWSPAIVAVSGNATYTATFKATKKTYTITWLNDDNSLIDQTTVEYGVVPAHANPTKQATAEFTYTFTGWTPEVVSVTGDATYTAQFNSTKNTYTITWLNWDNSQIDQTTVAFGELPTHTDAVKAATDEYTYTFKGWEPAVIAVAGNATYTAQFDSVKNTYTITWKNEDGSVIESETLEYGKTPEHTAPSKENTAEWTYTFTGWSPTIASVTGDAEYTATFNATKNKYLITFLNYDGTELQSGEVTYGIMPTYDGATPTKPADAQSTYTFAGWDNEIVEVNGAATYTATFSTTTNEYTITWLNWDNSQIDQTTVAYGELPTHTDAVKAATDEYTYTFKGWEPAVVAVAGDATYTAQFDSVKNSYIITWKNEDGSVIESETLEYGKTPDHTAPTKENTAEWTYTFTGWSPTIASVTGDAEYTATFSATKNKYLITFLNYDGTELQSGEVTYGIMPTYGGATPTKPADAQNTYTFAGWDNEIVEVNGTATYTATFSTTTNEYTITWLNDDGSTIDQSTHEYGVTPTHADATKANTAEYTYTFAGWTPAVVAVTEDATYQATFTEDTRLYTITWLNEDGSLIDQTSVAYNGLPTHADPTKASTAEHTYTFSGWSPAIAAVTEDASYQATFTEDTRLYTITWLNEDGSLIDQTSVAYNGLPTHEDPSKTSTAEHTYAFSGWTPAVVAATEDATYQATFTEDTRLYTITWFNEDGSLIDQTSVAYNGLPTHADAVKAATDEYTYAFAGWTPAIVAATEDATYQATFTENTRLYTITWLNEDGSLIDQTSVAYNGLPTHADPSKASTAEHTYAFAGWTPAVVAVTEDATYQATFTEDTRLYTITWLNEDGSLIDQTSVAYNGLPTHEDPSKASTAEHTYAFAGWTPAIVAATEDATYQATFTEDTRLYTITWFNEDGSLIDQTSVAYNGLPTHADAVKAATDEYTYTFKGWDPAVVAVTGVATYTAQFDSIKNSYTITWLNDDNSLIDESDVEYGVVPTHDDVVKAATDEYTYTFKGWNPAVVAVTGVATYTAQFDSVKNSYAITWLNDDNSLIDQTDVEYGATPTHDDAVKEATAEWTYTFTGWDPAIASVTGDATYAAQFDSTKNSYTVTWLNEDGTEIDHETLEYGSTPAHAYINKENTAEWTYSFVGWTPEIKEVTGDATYTATFDSVKNSYAVTFYDEDGTTVLDSRDWEYGAIPTCAEPTKPATHQYIYTFSGWTPEVVAVTGEAAYTATYATEEIKYHVSVTIDDATHGEAGFVYADSGSSTLLTEDDILNGTWIELRATAAAEWHFGHWSDGDTSAVRQVEVSSDMQFTAYFAINCGDYPSLPVVCLYDWLLMLDVRSIHDMGYSFGEEDVTWYRVHGEPDKLSDGASADDELLGTGYSFTLNQSLVNTGDYYAIVDISKSSSDMLCTDMMRSKIVHYASSGAAAPPMLEPALVRPNAPQRVHHLNPEASTTISIYDITGHLLRTFTEEGVEQINLQAEGVAGCYQIVVQNGDLRTVLRYIVVN